MDSVITQMSIFYLHVLFLLTESSKFSKFDSNLDLTILRLMMHCSFSQALAELNKQRRKVSYLIKLY